MKLDRSTYEAWLLDRIEGNLTPEQERALTAFLAANPDLDPGTGDLPTVSKENARITWKDELKKKGPMDPQVDRDRVNELLVARLEGDLTPEQALELNALLLVHPTLEVEGRRMAATKVQVEDVRFPAKELLARHFPPMGAPDAHRLTDHLIAALEGDLSAEQHRALTTYLEAHPEAQREQRLIAATRVSNEIVVYPHKELLKKRETRVIALWVRYAAAASIALLLGLGWWIGHDRTELPRIARKETPKPAPALAPEQHEGHAPVQQDVIPAPQRPAAPVRITPADHIPSHPGTGPTVEPTPLPQPQRTDPPRSAASEDPQLAQAPPMPHSDPAPGTSASPGAQASGTTDNASDAITLAAFAANTLRREVIDADERAVALDGTDALAAVDRGLNAITGGAGGLQVQHSAKRDRLKLRLGKHFAISASTSR